MGAGTTAAMAMASDRNFIGFEIDEKYYDIAMRRVEQRMARLPI